MNERYLPDVIQQILPLIPVDEEELIRALKVVYKNALYTAPEVMYEQWYYGSVALRTYFSKDLRDLNEWQFQVISIWNPEIKV